MEAFFAVAMEGFVEGVGGEMGVEAFEEFVGDFASVDELGEDLLPGLAEAEEIF